MPLTSTVIHPELMNELRPVFYRQVARIEYRDPAAAPSSFGEPAGFINLPGHTGIDCSLQRSATVFANERRSKDQTIAVQYFTCLLNGLYPEITANMHAVIDGTTYNITEPISDSQRAHTELTLEIVRP
jgi:hypothetical protein